MNTKYFPALTTLVLATGLSQFVIQTQAPQLTSLFINVLEKHSALTPRVQVFVPSTNTGQPNGRRGGGTRAA